MFKVKHMSDEQLKTAGKRYVASCDFSGINILGLIIPSTSTYFQ